MKERVAMAYPAYSKKKGRPGALAVVVWLFIIMVAALIVGNTVFAVRSISVEGNSTVSTEEVIRASGISHGTSIFAIDSGAVRNGVNSNRYLNFVGMWRDFPSHVILRVTEHSPHATFKWMGMLYMLDQDGSVLEQTAHFDIPLSVPLITGMQVEAARVGSPVVTSVVGQADTIATVLSALSRRGLTEGISELNVTSLDNLFLITVDGAQVKLGNAQNIETKLYLMEQVLSIERARGPVRYGVLDVTTAQNADYKPPAHVRLAEAREAEEAAAASQILEGTEETDRRD